MTKQQLSLVCRQALNKQKNPWCDNNLSKQDLKSKALTDNKILVIKQQNFRLRAPMVHGCFTVTPLVTPNSIKVEMELRSHRWWNMLVAAVLQLANTLRTSSAAVGPWDPKAASTHCQRFDGFGGWMHYLTELLEFEDYD